MKPTYEYVASHPATPFRFFGPTPAEAEAKLVASLPGESKPATPITVALSSLRLFIPGEPKARQSVTIITRKLKGGGKKRWAAHLDKADPWIAAAREAVRSALAARPDGPWTIDVPIYHPAALELHYFGPIPKRKNRPCPPGHPIAVRPDCTNLDKPLVDALRSGGAFYDDSRVFKQLTVKRYVEDPEAKDAQTEVGCDVLIRWHTEYTPVHPEKDSRSCKDNPAPSKTSAPSSAPKTKGRSTSGSRSTGKPSWAGRRRGQ